MTGTRAARLFSDITVAETFPYEWQWSNFLSVCELQKATDSQQNIGLLLQLTKALEINPNEVCTIYKMSPTTRRSRGINDIRQNY